MSGPTSRALGRALGRFARSTVLPTLKSALLNQRKRDPQRERAPQPNRSAQPRPSGGGYPGDFEGSPPIVYAPIEGDVPDPGEVVWTWVPYEEDYGKGKDRPVLIIARDPGLPGWLLALQLTSQDHDRDAAQEARAGRYWVDIGSGGWDNQRRPSEARVNRIIRIDPAAVRRISVNLSEERFTEVAEAVARHT